MYSTHLDKLSSAQVARLLRALALLDDAQDADLLEALRAEEARLVRIDKSRADYAADQQRRAVNAAYVRTQMKPGDIVEYTFYSDTGNGALVKRRMSVRSFDIRESGHSTTVNLTGVVVTKGGKPHATLNGRMGRRCEYRISLGDVTLVTPAAE